MTELQPTDPAHLTVHTQQLRTLARRLVDPQEVDDAVQDTLVAALQTDDRVRSPRPWLRRVLGNTVRARFRRTRRWDELRTLVPEAAGSDRPDDLAARAEIVMALREVLDGLDEPYRVVLRERFFADRSTIEIARRLDCPHGTVRWRLHEGLRRMKQALDRRFGDRDHWFGAMVALGGLPTEAAGPATGAVVMTKSTPLAHLTMLGVLAVAGAYAVLGTASSASPPGRDAEGAHVSASSSASASADPSGHAPPPGPAASVARSTRADGAATPRSTGAPTPTHEAESEPALPTMTRLQYEQCGRDAVAKYNAGDDGAAAAALLIEAAGCFEGAGLMGLAIMANRRLIGAFPEHAARAADENQRLYWLLLDPELALETPTGHQCVAPLSEVGSQADAAEYIAAADCLYSAGFVGAALHHRELASERPGTYDREAHAAEIARLTTAIAKVEATANRAEDDANP